MRQDNELMFIISDHLGSSSLVTDSSGNVINQTKYKACPLRFHYGMLRKGETRYTSGSEQTKYGYTGQYSYVNDFGLHFYNARWYDSSLGRFAQADTIVPSGSQGLDRYAYVNNSPILYVDPTGHLHCQASYCNPNLFDPFYISESDKEKVEQAEDGYEYWLDLGIESVNNLRSIEGWWTPYLDPKNGMDVWKFLLILAYAVEGYSIPTSSESEFFNYMTDSVINKAGNFYQEYRTAGLYLYIGTRQALTDRARLGTDAPQWIEGTAEYRNAWDFGPGSSGENP